MIPGLGLAVAAHLAAVLVDRLRCLPHPHGGSLAAAGAVLAAVLTGAGTMVGAANTGGQSPAADLGVIGDLLHHCRPFERDPAARRKVVLRIDDIGGDRVRRGVWTHMVDDAFVRDAPVVLGVVPGDLAGPDGADLVRDLRRIECNLELALHGGGDDGRAFRFLREAEADRRIAGGLEALNAVLDRPVRVFTPSEDAYSAGTHRALVKNGITRVSGGGTRYFDHSVATYDAERERLITPEHVVDACRRTFERRDSCIVMVRPADYVTDGQLDPEKYARYTGMLDRLVAEGVAFATFGDLAETPRLSASLDPWDRERGLDTLTRHTDVFTTVSPLWYAIEADGALGPHVEDEAGYRAVLNLLHARRIRVVPTVASVRRDDGARNVDALRAVLHHPERRARHVEAIARLVTARGFDGIDIDYGGLDAEGDRAAFSAFVEDLGAALHARNRWLAVSVPARAAGAADGNGDPAAAYDWRAIAAHADEVRIMLHDDGRAAAGSEPGPVAPIDRIERVLERAVAEIPRAKITAGLPLYGHAWTDDEGGTGVTWRDVEALPEDPAAPLRVDSRSMAATTTYMDALGRRHEVWFETAETLAAKLALLRDYGVGGASLRYLGDEDPRTWEVVKEVYGWPGPVPAAGS